ncbi:unnamed protein product [Moritella viscosa]|uniref:Uncharacterized protein n=1 Tax=Moritella viscosa TaxID=80854 RepID=A0ABY1HH05_9GAMM|nr:unnamed protein product [Moritella viscosa]SGZ05755.1 unnamed protein product [Moritella viscosa]SHO08739.1 unnamed protein product [Moritella viscosa]SHO08792.1 unnamed protein product [Moritella viscosa]SHO13341.1 unnamed protein product [Moritella viscosa]
MTHNNSPVYNLVYKIYWEKWREIIRLSRDINEVITLSSCHFSAAFKGTD